MNVELQIEFAGEHYSVAPGEDFFIGRMGDLVIDDNPFLHRRFLHLFYDADLWWLANVGDRLPAQLSDVQQFVRTTLAPGARLPIIFGRMMVIFGAGNTVYELELSVPSPAFMRHDLPIVESGDTTVGPAEFTDTQLLAILALAEPVLRRIGTGSWQIPSAVQAAKRLGWTQTRFNRKLDNVCDKLDRMGVNGLHGGPGKEAMNRRANLVDYAVSSRLVTAAQLRLLEEEAVANGRPKLVRGI